jgi:hypothetical protein
LEELKDESKELQNGEISLSGSRRAEYETYVERLFRQHCSSLFPVVVWESGKLMRSRRRMRAEGKGRRGVWMRAG